MTTQMLSPRVLIASLLSIALLYSANAAAEAGHVLFVLGQVHIVRADGTNLSAVKGLTIENGDVVKTELNGQVQLKMTDGGLLAIRPNSLFKIEDYQYNQNVATDKNIYKLIKGGFRSITGKVGETNKKAYAVKTPIATIGIRGTDYTARYCEFDCGEFNVENGLYVNVLTGGVALTNDAGKVDIGPTEFGYVADSWTAPTYIDNVPAELLFAANATNSLVANASTSTTTDLSGNTVVSQNLTSTTGEQLDTATLTLKTNSVNTNDQSPNTTTTLAKTGVTISSAFANGSSVNTDTEFAIDNTSHTLTALTFKQTDTGGNVTATRYQIGTATQTDLGYDASTQVSWGRWTSGTIDQINADGSTTTQTLTDANSLHWIATSPDNIATVLPSSGTATYKTFAGGFTATTDNFGNTGTLDTVGTSLTANFASQTADATIKGTMYTPNDPTLVTEYNWSLASTGMPIINGQFTGTGMYSSDHPFLDGTGPSLISGLFTRPLDANGIPVAATIAYTANATFYGTSNTLQGVAYLQRQ